VSEPRIWVCDVPRSSEFIFGYMPTLRSDPIFMDQIKALKPTYRADELGQPVAAKAVPA